MIVIPPLEKLFIFFLPLVTTGVVYWQCRRRGGHFSWRFVCLPPLLLPTPLYIFQLATGVDLSFLLLGETLSEWHILPYPLAAITATTTALAGKTLAPVRARLGTLSLPELFCLHAGMFTLGMFVSFVSLVSLMIQFGLLR